MATEPSIITAETIVKGGIDSLRDITPITSEIKGATNVKLLAMT